MLKKKRKILDVSQKLKFKKYKKSFCYPQFRLLSYKSDAHIKNRHELNLVLTESSILQKYNFDTTRVFFGKLFKVLRFGKMLRYPDVWGKYHCPVYLRVPITQKPLQVRMGKGKGPVVFWAAPVSIGNLFFQPIGRFLAPIYDSLLKASYKLPVSSLILSRSQRVLTLLKQRSFRLIKKKQKNSFSVIARKNRILAEVRNFNRYGVETIRRRTRIKRSLKRGFIRYRWFRREKRRLKKKTLKNIFIKRFFKLKIVKYSFAVSPKTRILKFSNLFQNAVFRSSSLRERIRLLFILKHINKSLLKLKSHTRFYSKRYKKYRTLSLRRILRRRHKQRLLFKQKFRKIRIRFAVDLDKVCRIKKLFDE